MHDADASGGASAGDVLAYLDDSPVALRVAGLAAAREGLALECHATPESLLAREGPPLRAVLLDVDLGGALDGPAVAHALRRENPALPVAFFTAEDVSERTAALSELGPVFAKPGALGDALRWLARHAG
jgi:DNA-binding response OmpR family regulator